MNTKTNFIKNPQKVLKWMMNFTTYLFFSGADFLIPVKGSSMQPRYNSGDIIACKKLAKNDLFFQWGKVYVLDTVQGLMLKRIQPGRDDEHILLVSDNDELYKPFQLHLSQINSIAIVMGVIRLV